MENQVEETTAPTTQKALVKDQTLLKFLAGEMQLFESMMKDVNMENRGEETMVKNLMTIACYSKDRAMQYKAVKYLLLADAENGKLSTLNGQQVMRVIKRLEKFGRRSKVPFEMGTVLYALQYERGDHLKANKIATSISHGFRK